ncbi:hypothetical protein LZ554_006320 [Drepanopeziza brunnea f. sp. 'monogermtubi']|nr:hypothetical protein LZ554_006320 [Drepanopeziza brunnea f. sp. 'monogermtubi']
MGGEDGKRKWRRDPAKPHPRHRRRQHQQTRSTTTTTTTSIAQSDLPPPSTTRSRRDVNIISSSYPPPRKEEEVLKSLRVKRRPGASSVSHSISSPALQRVRALLETRPLQGITQQQQQSRLGAPPRWRCSTSPLKVSSSNCLEVSSSSSSSRALTPGLRRRSKLLPPVPVPAPVPVPVSSRDFFAEWAGLDDIDWEPLMQISSPAERFAVPLVLTACAEDDDDDNDNEGYEDGDGDEAPAPSPSARRASTTDRSRQDVAIDEVVGGERIGMATRRGFKGESFGVADDGDGDDDGGDDTELLLREQLQAGVGANDGEVSRSASRPKRSSSTRTGSRRLEGARRWSGAGAEAGVTAGLVVGALGSEVMNEKGEGEGEAEEEEEEEEEKKHIVDKILGKRKFKGRHHYLVKWKGYAEVRDRTWEPCHRLGDDVPDVVREYEGRRMMRLRLRQKKKKLGRRRRK